MSANFYGGLPREQLRDKIGQLRRDMVHIERALTIIESKIRANVSADDMKHDYTLLYFWFLSAAESVFTMTWVAFGGSKVKAVIQDFQNRFSTFTTARAVFLNGRPK